MRTVSIYALCDPLDGGIRYIGKTIYEDLEKRLYQHIKDKRKSHRWNWIKGLWMQGLRPTIKLIEEVDELIWQDRERFWIDYYRSKGINLSNHSSGGLGGSTMSDDVKNRISIALKGKPKKCGEGASNSKLKSGEVELLYRIAHTNLFSAGFIGKMFKVSSHLVDKIKGGHNWKFLTEKIQIKRLKPGCFNRKFTESQVLEMRGMLAAGLSRASVMGKFNVSGGALSAIAARRTWKNI